MNTPLKSSICILIIGIFSNCHSKQESKSAILPHLEASATIASNTTTQADSIPTPASFTKLGEVKGDLDNDGQDELVVVYDTPKETDLGTERQLYIYKQRANQWKLWHKSIGAVLSSAHGGMMGDPFEGIAIEKRCIVIHHFGGSRQKWNYTHRYRFQQNDWYLIGATINFGSPCDYFETYDYNMSTGKINAEIETEVCGEEDDSKNSSTREKFTFTYTPAKPILMDGFYPGDNEVKIFAKNDKTFYY